MQKFQSKEYSLLDRAIMFAVDAHSGMVRKRGNTPYVLHPLEVAAVAGTMTDDQEVLAASVLHDTVEDTPATIEDIEKNFGARVAALVASETENKRHGLPPEESWMIRKTESLETLKKAEDPGVRIMWLSDKLSNMRSFHRLYEKNGIALWQTFNQKDPEKQAWYYRTIAEYTRALADTDAWKEYDRLTETVFKGVK